MATLYTLGHNSIKKLLPIARIFSFITHLERLVPPFWFYVYGTKGLILIPCYSKYFIFYNFYIIILLLHLSTIRDTFYYVLIFIKKCLSVKMINLAVLLLE